MAETYDPLGYCDDAAKRRRHASRADRALGGSRKSAIELACLHCMGWIGWEITECAESECPLWGYRPKFKKPEPRKATHSVPESTNESE